MCFSLIVCHGSHWKRGWRDALAGHARSNDELYDMLPNMIQDGIEEKETKWINSKTERTKKKILIIFVIFGGKERDGDQFMKSGFNTFSQSSPQWSLILT